MKGNIYVDNVITGTKDDKEAVEFYDGVKEMFARASMNIREWASNSEQLNAHIPVKDKANGDSLYLY